MEDYDYDLSLTQPRVTVNQKQHLLGLGHELEWKLACMLLNQHLFTNTGLKYDIQLSVSQGLDCLEKKVLPDSRDNRSKGFCI